MHTAPLALALTMTGAQAQPIHEYPQESSLITYERPQRWDLQSRFILLARETVSDVGFGRPGRTRRPLNLDEWRFDEFVAVTPFVQRSASSYSVIEKPIGWLQLGDARVDLEPTIIGPYHSQAAYARWDSPMGTARNAVIQQTTRVISFEVKFDEEAAMRVGWPTAWPAEAQSTFLPQQFVSLDATGNPFDAADTTIKDLLAAWNDGNDPKSIPPVQLAKWLAGNVQEYVNTIRPGRTNRRNIDIEVSTFSNAQSGLDIKTAIETARSAEGTPHDMTILLTALYREAGLPARMLIGYQEDEENGGRRLSQQDQIRSWVEFALFDEDSQELTWVPVDVQRLREDSTRMRPLNQRWPFFGSHDELDDVVPIAMHIHPPTDVRSYGAPSMFGITMTPAPPEFATQFIDFTQTGTAITAKDYLPPEPD